MPTVASRCGSSSSSETLLHVLVIAHPDDESMFFVPCLQYLKQRSQSTLPVKVSVWLLCLTTGNYDGLGSIRSSELHTAATTVLGIDKVILLDEPSIEDHPTKAWNIETTADIIQATLSSAFKEENRHGTTTCLNLITFDEDGVSGHANHRDTYYAVRHLYWKQQQYGDNTNNNDYDNRLACIVTAWSLETVHNPIVKYIPALEWIRLALCWCGWVSSVTSSWSSLKNDKTHHGSAVVISYRMLQPSLNWKAMAAHHSQFVWYRRLFVVFSIYTYVNRLHRMDDEEEILPPRKHD